jgi:hypothetical protein
VYELVDGVKTVAEINELTFLSEFDGCKAFFDLVSRGLIEELTVEAKAGGAGAPSARLEAVPRAARTRIDATVFVGLGVAMLALAGLRYQSRNPANVLTIPWRRVPVVEGFDKSLSLLRLRRVAEAVDTYCLISGRFPESLDVLISSHILAPADLKDPWGNKYRYILQGEKYYAVGFDRDGKTDIDLLFSRSLVLKAPEPGTATAPPPKSGKEVIVVE